MSKLFKSFLWDDSGATAIEYALIAGFLSVVILGGVTAVAAKVSHQYEGIAGALP
jgi:pilus assembly protein Flp/PilA